MYTSGLLKTLSLRRKDGSNTKPSSPSSMSVPQTSSHIASCMREEADWSGSFLSSNETTSTEDCKVKINVVLESKMESDKTRYKLWPRASPSSSTASTLVDIKDQALAIGRSSTSLSDTAIVQSHRGGSLLRRRNISVPELKDNPMGKIINTNDFADSPTIPGRPPLRNANSDMPSHERSASVPATTWRESPFGDAMLSTVTGPTIKSSPSKTGRSRLAPLESNGHFVGKLSPIFSPTVAKTPITAIHRSPSQSPSRSTGRSPATSSSRSPSRSPVLEQSPDIQPRTTSIVDVPPPVPPKDSPMLPKDSPMDVLSPIRANTTMKRANAPKSHVRAKLSFGTITEIPAMPLVNVEPSTRPIPDTTTDSSATSKSETNISPQRERVGSPDLTMMDRPRPNKGSLRRQRSAPVLPKALMDAPSPQAKQSALLASAIEPQAGDGALPTGLKPMEAVLVLPNAEREMIRSQATSQAENFEILGSKLVTQLSRELRALDERCEYLRKTYKGLRAGRQKLHTRMISYLKSDSLTFSKERLLQQQEALIELDSSIDDWLSKLEKAENRRLRLRQKLLEHVAASMTLSSPAKATHSQDRHLETPPRSPIQNMSATSSPESITNTGRRDVESIKIYADSITLFNDIEMAVTKMCEAC